MYKVQCFAKSPPSFREVNRRGREGRNRRQEWLPRVWSGRTFSENYTINLTCSLGTIIPYMNSKVCCWQGELHSLNFSLGSPGNLGTSGENFSILSWEKNACVGSSLIWNVFFKLLYCKLFFSLCLNLFVSESRIAEIQDECSKASFDIEEIVLHKLLICF